MVSTFCCCCRLLLHEVCQPTFWSTFTQKGSARATKGRIDGRQVHHQQLAPPPGGGGATTDGTWPSTSKHLYSYQHNFASVDVLQCSATVSACVAASGPPCVPVSGCVCCCWRRLRTVDGCTDRISGWLVAFAQQLLF